MPDRKSLQQVAKDLGLPATGTTKEIAQIVGIGEKSPYEWTREEFNEIAPHLSIHQDMRPGSDARAPQIMERGLQSGMVDSVGAWGRNHTWAGGKMAGDNAYLFVSSKLKYSAGNLNPWLDEGNIPIARIKTKPGQTDIYEALIASRPQDTPSAAPRGQAMPDAAGAFDAAAGAYLIAAGDGESLPVYQQADKRGKPAVDGTGKAKFVPVDYDLLHGPGITKYTGPGPEDTTKPNYKGLAYDITQKGQREIDAAIDSGAADSAANRVVDFTVEAMKNREIAAGKGWYSRMREKLLSAFGEKGRELFAQLLGATSAKTPVEPNFLQAFDAFEGINAGRYDRHRKAYLDMLESEDGNNLAAVIVERGYTNKVRAVADSLSKEARKLKGKKKAEVLFKAGKLRDLAKKPASQWTRKDRFDITILAEDILPLRSNGKKFNSNSHAVLKVIAGTWLNNRKSPKTPNFAGNLTGRTLQATIDVWAARHLRELIYGGGNEPWRIQPRSEVGVNPQDFALGQIIMQRAAKKLDMNPDDLQAILWFAEKNKWDANGWTGTEGANKSSFDTTFDRAFPSGQKPLTFQEVSKILSEED